MNLSFYSPAPCPGGAAPSRDRHEETQETRGWGWQRRPRCLGAPCRCSRVAPHKRENCGFPGITSDQCFSSGCCFDSSVVGVPWCFHPLPKQASEECVMEVSARRNCGYPGISPEECASRKCCFSDNIFEVPWCFFPMSVEDCHY
uniref:Trefoil factor 2 n=1 Tax=Felis catus TaxID=9685 RepID=A0ABI8A0D0_FELCA